MTYHLLDTELCIVLHLFPEMWFARRKYKNDEEALEEPCHPRKGSLGATEAGWGNLSSVLAMTEV